MISTLNDLLALIKQTLESIGIKSGVAQIILSILSILFIIIIGFKQIYYIVTYLIKLRANRLAGKDLHPFYSQNEIREATKYYIKTKYQNVPPTEDEEPGRNYIVAAKEPLIPLFINKIFDKNKDDNKYFLVLADTGMGKTTFLINLYLAYKFKFRWFWQRAKYNIKLFPLGHESTFKKIDSIPSSEKETTILLLDAFDEDSFAILDYKKRLDELIRLVWEFRIIIITCRTQFFPSSIDEPTETGRYKFGPKSGEHHFQKVYVSVFSILDIKKYLKKRFKTFLIFKNPNYIKAWSIVLKSPNLMMRPMLLSHIYDLLSVKTELKYGYQIYAALINQWLNREADKPGIKAKYQGNYKTLLLNFSKALAKDLYLNKGLRNNKMSLMAGEIIDNPNGLQLKDIEGNSIEIDKNDQSGRSLLNRNAIGEYKFSHKSILEYFIALEVFNNNKFRETFQFTSDIDAAKKFYLEMLMNSGLSKKDISKRMYVTLGITNSDINKLFINTFSTQDTRENLRKLFGLSLKESINSGFFISILSSIFAVALMYFDNSNGSKNISTIFENKFYIPLFAGLITSSALFLYYAYKLRNFKKEMITKKKAKRK